MGCSVLIVLTFVMLLFAFFQCYSRTMQHCLPVFACVGVVSQVLMIDHVIMFCGDPPHTVSVPPCLISEIKIGLDDKLLLDM